MPSNKKILIITYYWPPCGGAGVQRWLKFAKYLPEYGWEPIVLTVDPDYAQYPAFDESLKKEINPSLKVHKTKALNYFRFGHGKKSEKVTASFDIGGNGIKSRVARFLRGNFFIPDPRKGWNRYAVNMAAKIIAKEDIKYVVTTSPPHSTQLIGLKLKFLFPEIKWISDLRDPWTDIYYYRKFYGTLPARLYDRKLERKVLQKADKIITVGQSLAELFASKLDDLDEKISVITNGYDEEDFKGIGLSKKKDTKIITYVGTISTQYPVQTFLDSITQLYLSNNEQKYLVRFVGSINQEIKSKIENSPSKEIFEIIPYTDHAESIRYMVESDILLLIIPDHKHNKLIITGKLFEYLRAGKPIIYIGPPNGDAAEIINDSKAGYIYEISDYQSIIDVCKEKKYKVENDDHVLKYSHKNIVSKLILSLEE